MTILYSWQQSDWKQFTFDEEKLKVFDKEFSHLSGISFGIYQSLVDESKEQIRISLLSDEAFKTSEIEGEILDRESLQSSIREYFSLNQPINKNHPKENGIAQMMVDLYVNFNTPLTEDILFHWHKMLMNGRTDLDAIGAYRFHKEPMQIVSGRMDHKEVFYEAPPSQDVPQEMKEFIEWFNSSKDSQSALIKAGIAHLYFELIHPFEDGNGRIGRALIEKLLAQAFNQPTFIAVSQIIQANRKAYYSALEEANKSNEITKWLIYFCKTIIEAQKFTIDSLSFLVRKAKFFDKFKDKLNDRQYKLVDRIFEEGIKGFLGGVSIKNYISITKTSRATANRDLMDMVEHGMMKFTGELKNRRYWLILEDRRI
jgi:Fic family protein